MEKEKKILSENKDAKQKEERQESPPNIPDGESNRIEVIKKWIISHKIITAVIIMILILVIILMNPSKKIVGKDLKLEIGEMVYLDAAHLVDDTKTNIDLDNVVVEGQAMADEYGLEYDSYSHTVNTKGLNCLDSGTYEVELRDKDDENIKTTVQIVVTDKEAPKFVNFKNEIEVDEGDKNVKLDELFEAEDDSKVTITVQKGDFNIDKPGNYKVKVSAKDTAGNTTTKTATIKVLHKNLASIEAQYNGSTVEGTTINSNSRIKVIAKYEDGSSKEVYDWTIDNPVTLKADESSTVTIKYQDKSCDITIQCSTVGEQGFKNSCTDIAYEELARNGDSHVGDKVKFYGQVLQVMNGSGKDVTLRVATKSSAYGNWYDDVVLVQYEYKSGQSKFLEDDMVTFYGYVYGDYSYEAVSGATITIPAVLASYIDMA